MLGEDKGCCLWAITVRRLLPDGDGLWGPAAMGLAVDADRGAADGGSLASQGIQEPLLRSAAGTAYAALKVKHLGDTVAVVERYDLPHAEARADLDRQVYTPRFRGGQGQQQTPETGLYPPRSLEGPGMGPGEFTCRASLRDRLTQFANHVRRTAGQV